jgi:hypothetical protein
VWKRVSKMLTVAVVVGATFALPRPVSLEAASAVATPMNFRFSAPGLGDRSDPCRLKGLHYMWFPAGNGRQQLCQLVRILVAELTGSE